MAKNFTRIIIFSLLFLFSSCVATQSISSETNILFFEGNIDKTLEIFIFDGFKLSRIDRDSDSFKKKVPVTQGYYFVLFFTKRGCIPQVKVCQAGKKNIKMGKIELEKMTDEDKGFLVGVVYKPVYGGKIAFRKGIVKFSGGMNIRVVNDKGESYIVKSGDNGVFCIRLAAGKYKIFAGDSKKGVDVAIKEGITTIQNLQKGLVLID